MIIVFHLSCILRGDLLLNVVHFTLSEFLLMTSFLKRVGIHQELAHLLRSKEIESGGSRDKVGDMAIYHWLRINVWWDPLEEGTWHILCLCKVLSYE